MTAGRPRNLQTPRPDAGCTLILRVPPTLRKRISASPFRSSNLGAALMLLAARASSCAPLHSTLTQVGVPHCWELWQSLLTTWANATRWAESEKDWLVVPNGRPASSSSGGRAPRCCKSILPTYLPPERESKSTITYLYVTSPARFFYKRKGLGELGAWSVYI